MKLINEKVQFSNKTDKILEGIVLDVIPANVSAKEMIDKYFPDHKKESNGRRKSITTSDRYLVKITSEIGKWSTEYATPRCNMVYRKSS